MRTIEDHELSREVIGSRAFRAYAMADAYRDIARRTGQNFDAAIALLDRLPTFMAGERHKQVRRAMARQNEASKPAQVEAAAAFLADFAATTMQPSRTVDLLGDFARPLFRAMAGAASALGPLDNETFSLIERVPALFSSMTPLKDRLETNAMIESVLGRAGPNAIDDVSLLVLGIYPLTGSIALTLHDAIRANPGLALAQVRWPDWFSHTALHYVDRVCREPVSAGGQDYTPGDRAHCFIRHSSWSNAQNRAMTYGSGSHLCLGRALSEQVWTMVTTTFAQSALHASAGEMPIRTDSEPFRLPARAMVTFGEQRGGGAHG
jgi:cytochrome P450